LVELPSQHRLTALAGGDAVDACLWWVSPSLSSVHAETGLSQVQILPARLNPKLAYFGGRVKIKDLLD